MAFLTDCGEEVKQSHLAHLLRAAARIVKGEQMLVIGSQSILATYPEDELPEVATMSMEADVAFFDDPDNMKSDIAESLLGELSMFHEAFGYYLQSVSLETAVLPDGWERRLVPFSQGNYGDADARCLEVHDLAIAKLVANRSKDREFVQALMTEYIALQGILTERALELDEPYEVVSRVLGSIRALSPVA